jgi:hypothetical protein
MDRNQSPEDPAERGLFDTIKSTYALALEPEQQAMIKELRHRLPTIPAEERMALIDSIENAVGQNLEEELDY